MYYGFGAGGNGEGFSGWAKAGSRNGERIDAKRDLWKGELTLGVGGGVEREGGVACMESDGGVGDWTMLWIVYDAM